MTSGNTTVKTTKTRHVMTNRATMALTGGLAGLAAWVLVDVIPDVVSNPHALVVLSAMVAGYFFVLLAISGPVPLRRAAYGAAVLAVPAALLLGWTSLGFDTVQAFLDSGFPMLAWAIILGLGMPFVAVWLWDRKYWNSYLDLFDFSWSIVVRYAAAWLFVGVFWAVLFLSDALLSLVSITIIEDLIDYEPVPQVLTGAVFGLALRVVFEMRDYLSPYLLLRLLRLLLPVCLVVVVVFVIALPLSDPSGMFGGLSPAATLMSVALGGICLVSIALDKSDADAVQAIWMQLAARAMALLLPVLAGLACYGIWLRVAQYGWTPDRLAAAMAAAVVSAYSLFYFASAIVGGEWMRRIRARNLLMVGVILGLCVVWLSGILSPEAISTRSQVARYLNGSAKAHDLPVWEMTHAWGKSGQAGVRTLQNLTGAGHSDLQRVLRIAADEDRKHSFTRRVGNTGRDAKIDKLVDLIRLLDSELALAPGAFRRIADYQLDDWLAACGRAIAPGCLLFLGDLDANVSGQEGILFQPDQGDRFLAISVRMENHTLVAGKLLTGIDGSNARGLTQADMQRLLGGDFRIAPSSRNSLWIGDLELHPEN